MTVVLNTQEIVNFVYRFYFVNKASRYEPLLSGGECHGPLIRLRWILIITVYSNLNFISSLSFILANSSELCYLTSSSAVDKLA